MIPDHYNRRILLYRRSHRPHVFILSWLAKQVTGVTNKIVREDKQWDEALAEYLCQRAALWYAWGTRFAWAHAPASLAVVLWGVNWLCWGNWWAALACVVLVPFTFVGRKMYGRRLSCCTSCPHRGRDEGGVERCHGYAGNSTCRCPKWLWWIFSYLKWQRWLRFWECPQGEFLKLRGKPVGVSRPA